jgi:hypothetical protein
LSPCTLTLGDFVALSSQAKELNQRIEWQDNLLAMALVEGASDRFLARIRAVRNDLVREWGAQIQRDQFDAHSKAGA